MSRTNLTTLVTLLVIAAIASLGSTRATAQDFAVGGSVSGSFGNSGLPVFMTGPDPLLEENKALQNDFLRQVIRQADLLNKRTGLENQWMAVEVKSLVRYYFQLSRDEREARAKKASLAAQRAGLVRSVNAGHRSIIHAASLRKSLSEVPHDSQIQTVLRQELTAAKPTDFVAPGTSLFRLVQADGTLSGPPALLVSEETGAASNRAMAAFSSVWEEAAAALRSDRAITRRHITDLTAALGSYKVAAREMVADGSLGARSSAQEYVVSMQVLVDVLGDARRGERLKTYLKAGGFHFDGGTVAELVQWMEQNDVAPVYGSEPQMALASLAEQLLARIDARINVLDAEIKFLKSQSPKHDAATKQRLAGAATGYGIAGVSSVAGTSGAAGGITPALGGAEVAAVNPPLANGAVVPAAR